MLAQRAEFSELRQSLQAAGIPAAYQVETNFLGIKTAVFKSNEYVPAFEEPLRKLGIDLIVIESPSTYDRELSPVENGFYHKPEAVNWRLRVQSEREYLVSMDSKGRNRFKSKLKKSEGVAVELQPLSEKDFREWYPIYESEIVGKDRGKRVIGADWAEAKEDLSDCRKLFFRDPVTKELLGGALVKVDKKSGTATIAYAAYKSAARDRELSIRTFTEAMEFARSHGYHQLSYGSDTNLYGQHLSLGLMEYKAALGFAPVAAGKTELLKVLNPGKLSGEYFLFSINDDGSLKGNYFSDAPRNLITPKKMATTVGQAASREVRAARQSPIRFLHGIRSMEQADRLLDLYLELFHPDDKHFFLRKAPAPARKDPFHKVLRIVSFLRQGFGALDFFIEAARKRGFIGESEIILSSTMSRRMASEPKFTGKLAAYLGQRRDLMSFWKPFFSEILHSEFGSLDALKTASSRDAASGLRTIFDNVEARYGKRGLNRLVAHLESALNLSEFEKTIDSISAAEPSSLEGHLTVTDLHLEKYFGPGDIRRAAQLVDELQELFLRSQIDPRNTGTRLSIIYSGTMGGVVVGLVKDILDLDIVAMDRIMAGYLNPLGLGNSGASRMTMSKIHELRRMKKSNPEKPQDLASNIDHLFSTAEDESDFKGMLVAAGLDPSDVHFWGKRSVELLREIFERTTRDQKISMISHLSEQFPFNDAIKLALSEVEAAPDHVPSRPIKRLRVDPRQMAELVARLAVLSFDSRSPEDFARYIAKTLKVKLEISSSASPNDLMGTILRNYLSLHGRLPEITDQAIQGWLVELAVTNGDVAPICSWLAAHPDVEPSTSSVKSILESFNKNRSSDHYATSEILFLLRAMGSSEQEFLAENILRHIPRNAKFFGVLTGPSKDEYQAEIQRNLPWLRKTPRQTAAIQRVLNDLLVRAVNGPTGENKRFISGQFQTVYSMLIGIDAPLANYWGQLKRFAEQHPVSALSVLEVVMSHHETRASPADRAAMHEVFYAILRSSGLAQLDVDQWRRHLASIPDTFTKIPWPEHDSLEPNPLVAEWIRRKVRSAHVAPEEARRLALWTLDHSKDQVVDEITYEAMAFANGNAAVLDAFKRKVSTQPLKDSRLYSKFVDFFERIDPMGEARLRDSVFANKEFFLAHPWGKYGYSYPVVAKIHAFVSNPDFTSRQADLLLSLLYSHREKSFNKTWISQLLLSTPDHGFHTLVRFLQYWQSLDVEARDRFLATRVDDLLADVRISAAKDAQGAGFDAVTAQIETLTAAKKPIPPGLKNRFDKLLRYRQLFRSLSDAMDITQRQAILDQINDEALKDWPPKIRPENEKQLLIDKEVGRFHRAIGTDSRGKEQTEKFILENLQALQASGVMDRWVQYAGFADPQGLDRLKAVVAAYSDPSQARFVEVTRPDLGGKKTTHFDYFGKFSKLNEALLKKGVRPAEIARFMEQWRKLWHFDSLPSEGNEYFSVTHDLERWVKHGEDPVLSCQRISSKSGDMGPRNWNHQFGANPNADGRPLGRILLPQLKLAEMRQDGNVTARSMLEVTVEIKDGKPTLSLLVEAIYAKPGFHRFSEFHTAVKKYAASLGISEQQIYFASDGSAVDRAPEPLPEEYRIYRDSFHRR